MIEYYEKLSENRGMAKETRIFENTDEVVEQWRKPYQRIIQRYLKRQRSRGTQGSYKRRGVLRVF